MLRRLVLACAAALAAAATALAPSALARRRRRGDRKRSLTARRATAVASAQTSFVAGGGGYAKKTQARHDEFEEGAKSSSGYDAEEIADGAMKRPAEVALRFARVASALASFALRLKLDEMGGKTGPESVREQARVLRDLLVELGPVYIKVGQALANRPDIVRDDFMGELEALQDSVPQFDDVQAMEILREELGRDPSQVFSELTNSPVAAASLGQVYRGRLRSNGMEVAVKVQRPNLRVALSIDMYIFRQLSQLLNDWARKQLGCNITLVVDEFGSKLWEESDYTIELENARDFAVNFAGDATVKIPQVFPEFSGKRAITMEWINGVKSSDLDGMRREGIDPEKFTVNGVQAALRQLLEFGLFHGDPHAGNIFAMQGGKIAYVDFGNVAFISPSQRDVITRAVVHVSNSDYKEIANDFIRLGFLRPGYDTSEIVPAMAEIWKESLGKSIRDFNFRTVTGYFSKLVFRFPMRVPERFSLVFRALLMQEGICIQLNPEFSIIEVALPYASKRLLSDPDPSMRKELMGMVFVDDGAGQQVVQWKRLKEIVNLARQAQDGTNIRFDEVIINFFRGLRRDVLREGTEAGVRLPLVLRSTLKSLTAGEEFSLREVTQIFELLSPDLTPQLARKVADALLADTIQELLALRGVEVSTADAANPRLIAQRVLRRPEELQKLLPRAGELLPSLRQVAAAVLPAAVLPGPVARS